MAAIPARLRLYQYPSSPFCISIELLLRDSGLSYETVDLPHGNPANVIELTKGAYYQVPLLEDLASHDLIYENSPAGEEIPRYVDALASTLKLFPSEMEGMQRILISYIENDCEAIAFKVLDAGRDRWLKNDLERGLHRRHKERKFGPGCLENWDRDLGQLISEFHRLITPFESIVGRQQFLGGEHPIFADYALAGVIGTFLYAGTVTLPPDFLLLEAWYARMRSGAYRDARPGPITLSSAGATPSAAIFVDVAPMEMAIAELKLRPGSSALDVGTGHGHVALALAARGFQVTACDANLELLHEAVRLADEKKLTVTFHQHLPEQLPYADNSFSLVTSWMSAHHFGGPGQFVREAMRVLKPYGYLVLMDGTAPDDQVEAHQWMNALERLRDPEHIGFVTPNVWRQWCTEAGLTVTKLKVEAVQQLDWEAYFQETHTPPENRPQIMDMLTKAPKSVRELFKINHEGGRIIWSQRRLTLVAGKV